VLVVEDDTLVRVMICEDLRDAGLSVVEAATADEALSYLGAGQRIDLVFTDIQMPGRLDGIGLARLLRERHPALPVVLTSGTAVPPDDLDGALFLPKPYDHRRVAEIALELTGPQRREAE
jgi:CheY-like chemotaxis protein